MFKNILLLILIGLVAWMSQDYFSIIMPKQEPVIYTPADKNLKIKNQKTEDQKLEQNTPIQKVQSTLFKMPSTLEKVTKPKVPTLTRLLKEDKFYEAIEFYLSSNSESQASYRKQIYAYLNKMVQHDAMKALEYMRVYKEEVTQSNVLALMVDTYMAQGNYKQAIAHIIEAKENYISEHDDRRLERRLKTTAKVYIQTLQKSEDYSELISFLEDMITFNDRDSYYTFALAKLYADLDKNEEALLLFEGLEYDDTYGEMSVNFIKNIEQTPEEESYDFSIPLGRYGEHFTAPIRLDGRVFNLMLDTGASYIFLDQDKGARLQVIDDNLLLRTAGNTIRANLANVSVLEVGDLKLENIKVTLAPFKRDGIDGLLGMNFFKQFSFYINQDEAMLYLNAK